MLLLALFLKPAAMVRQTNRYCQTWNNQMTNRTPIMNRRVSSATKPSCPRIAAPAINKKVTTRRKKRLALNSAVIRSVVTALCSQSRSISTPRLFQHNVLCNTAKPQCRQIQCERSSLLVSTIMIAAARRERSCWNATSVKRSSRRTPLLSVAFAAKESSRPIHRRTIWFAITAITPFVGSTVTRHIPGFLAPRIETSATSVKSDRPSVCWRK